LASGSNGGKDSLRFSNLSDTSKLSCD
jgi:hypothetical protein